MFDRAVPVRSRTFSVLSTLTPAITMSASPPLRRLSETSSSSKESLINAYEAEEERIINILSRKLEKVIIAISAQRTAETPRQMVLLTSWTLFFWLV